VLYCMKGHHRTIGGRLSSTTSIDLGRLRFSIDNHAAHMFSVRRVLGPRTAIYSSPPILKDLMAPNAYRVPKKGARARRELSTVSNSSVWKLQMKISPYELSSYESRVVCLDAG
jgi:hypothetical protein